MSTSVTTASCDQIPGFRSEDATDVMQMVEELAEDLDRGIALGGRYGFNGAGLRRHYAELLRQYQVEAVLADAKRRWDAQVICCVLPLPVND
jgi:hypothetical protein